MEDQSLHDPNAAQPVSDFTVIKGEAPKPEIPQEPLTKKYFNGNTEELAKAYGELQSKFSGDLGSLKHTVTSYNDRFFSLEKMISELGTKFPQPQEPAGQPPQPRQELDPWSRVKESYDKYDSDGFIESLKQVTKPGATDEIKTLAETVKNLSQSLSPDNLVKMIQSTAEELQTKRDLEREKRDLLTGGYSEDLINLAGVTAYQNGKGSYLEGLEILRSKFPSMFETKKDSVMERIARTPLPSEMPGQVPEVSGLAALNKQFDQVVQFKTPSSVLMNLATRR